MPSILSHAVFAGALGRFFSSGHKPAKLFLLGMCCGMLPDADVIGFSLEIEYASTFGHRGFTHSIFFAVLTALAVVFLFYRSEKLSTKTGKLLFFYFFLATLSHPILDAMTTGGLGVAFFSPFSNHRYFFPIRPIRVAHIGIEGFFRHDGLAILRNELFYVWLPAGVIFVIALLTVRKQKKATL